MLHNWPPQRIPARVQKWFVLVNAVLPEKEEMITGGSCLKLRVYGLEIAGKVAAFV